MFCLLLLYGCHGCILDPLADAIATRRCPDMPICPSNQQTNVNDQNKSESLINASVMNHSSLDEDEDAPKRHVIVAAKSERIEPAVSTSLALPPMQPSVAKKGLHILYEVFRLGYQSSVSTSLSDIVLIAIDFENINTIKSGFSQKSNCQVGLAILDTKDIHQVPPGELISTYNIATGSPSYLAKVSRKFMFGETVTTRTSDIVDRILSLIPPGRNVVFVGHGILNDIQALQALGFPFPARLSGTLDTSLVANEVFQFWAGSLADLLLALRCPFNRLHCAGNDANFTLKALLLLVAEGFANQQQIEDQEHEMLAILRQISTSPIPDWVDPEVQAMEKRERRRERSRKHQSKTWDKDKQDQIRAARAYKKQKRQEIEDQGPASCQVDRITRHDDITS